MTGAADIAVTVILVAILCWIGCKLFLWMGEQVINSVDWMTRGERK